MPDPGFLQPLLTYGPELNGNEGWLILFREMGAYIDAIGKEEQE